MHFFKNKADISHIKSAKFLPEGNYYICEFNIPVMMLIGRCGEGYYGYTGDLLRSAKEFKLPAKLMRKKYLKSYELDKTHRSSIYDNSMIGLFSNGKPIEFRFSDIEKIKEEDKAK